MTAVVVTLVVIMVYTGVMCRGVTADYRADYHYRRLPTRQLPLPPLVPASSCHYQPPPAGPRPLPSLGTNAL